MITPIPANWKFWVAKSTNSFYLGVPTSSWTFPPFSIKFEMNFVKLDVVRERNEKNRFVSFPWTISLSRLCYVEQLIEQLWWSTSLGRMAFGGWCWFSCIHLLVSCNDIENIDLKLAKLTLGMDVFVSYHLSDWSKPSADETSFRRSWPIGVIWWTPAGGTTCSCPISRVKCTSISTRSLVKAWPWPCSALQLNWTTECGSFTGLPGSWKLNVLMCSNLTWVNLRFIQESGDAVSKASSR